MAENALTVQFESAYGMVELSPEIVTKYLKRGNAELTDQEIRMFIELCKFQKLNPFVGEAYAIKFGQEFQMIVGYDTYKRRAEQNPSYCGRRSGIVVLRGNEVVQKEGTCLYPGEQLIGGWCRVFREMANGRMDESYKEVGLNEYQKMKDGRPQANWGTKPATMIEKVAVSQALRAAFPSDYTGLYTSEEIGGDSKDARVVIDVTNSAGDGQKKNDGAGDVMITKEERKELFDLATAIYGAGDGVSKVRELIEAEGVSSTNELSKNAYMRIMKKLGDEVNRIEAEASVK